MNYTKEQLIGRTIMYKNDKKNVYSIVNGGWYGIMLRDQDGVEYHSYDLKRITLQLNNQSAYFVDVKNVIYEIY